MPNETAIMLVDNANFRLSLLLSQVARYMNQLRHSRLERVQNRQDDEVVGIAGLYLSITLLILFMAALTNLPL